MCEGVEGQFWKGGLLIATRWWPTAPGARDWSTFLRAAGVDVTQANSGVLEPLESEILDQPWTVESPPITDLWSLFQNERAATVAATAIAVPFIYFLVQATALLAGTMRVEAAIAAMSAANQTIRTDRAAAFRNLDAIESYLGLTPYPSQFVTMNAVLELLRGSDVEIAEWNFDSGSLQIVIQADRALGAPFFIEMFEKSDYFKDVTAIVGNQQRELRLSMQMEPQVWPIS